MGSGSSSDNRGFLGISRGDWAVAAAVAALTVALYARTVGFDFVDFDDPEYLLENHHLSQGTAVDVVRWAFTTFHLSNWHPLTWISHAIDLALFGRSAVAHHLGNLLLHTANATLLFLVMRSMTGARWRSALLAALFALHPLRVESVAWISERKAVLCAFFWILTIGAHLRFARRPGIGRFLAVPSCMALSLLSKPTSVTIPFVLLLLDVWPLNRLSQPGHDWSASARRLLSLIGEKVPLLALSAAVSVLTLLAPLSQAQVIPLESLPLARRAAVAVVAAATYIAKTFAPTGLAFLYPYPASVPAWQATGAALLLVSLTVVFLRRPAARPFCVVGWLWYLGTLVPMSGIVQVGFQAMADRYTYLPHVGLLLAVVWGAHAITGRRRLAAGIAVAAVATLALLSWRQMDYWRSSIALFERAIDVTDRNYFAHNNLGLVHLKEGRTQEAIAHFFQALEYQPRSFRAHANLALALERLGRAEESLLHFERSVEIVPDDCEIRSLYAQGLDANGRHEEAVVQFREVARRAPTRVAAHINLGVALFRGGEPEAAAASFRKALHLEPGNSKAQEYLGIALAKQGSRRDKAD